MKKNSNYITSETGKSSLNKNTEIDKIKTTNVNILLNRVRLDQKRNLKKRIVFSIILVGLVSSLAFYFYLV